MSYQDWKVSWIVKEHQVSAGISVDTLLDFNGETNSWEISTTPSSSWSGVNCTYDDRSDTVTGYKGGSLFTIVRSAVVSSGKDYIRCDMPQGGAASKVCSSGAPGGTWTAEEGSGVC